jgi:hypothetical protein
VIAALKADSNGKWVMVNEEMGSGGWVVEWMVRIGCWWWYVWVGHGERTMEVWWSQWLWRRVVEYHRSRVGHAERMSQTRILGFVALPVYFFIDLLYI